MPAISGVGGYISVRIGAAAAVRVDVKSWEYDHGNMLAPSTDSRHTYEAGVPTIGTLSTSVTLVVDDANLPHTAGLRAGTVINLSLKSGTAALWLNVTGAIVEGDSQTVRAEGGEVVGLQVRTRFGTPAFGAAVPL